MDILDYIKANKERKEAQGVYPTHTLYQELKRSYNGLECDLRHILNKLHTEDKIIVGQTINDLFIKLK